MVIEHISPHSGEAVCLCRTTQAFIRPRPLGLEGRKLQVEDHTHLIVTLQFYDSQEAVEPRIGSFFRRCRVSCLRRNDKIAHSNLNKAAHHLIIVWI